MLSVNIPVFNIDVTPLVKQLVLQAEKLRTGFEIRVYDDGSNEKIKLVNREIQHLPGVVYKELLKNLGRAAIRNKMGMDSVFEYLLFIDADSLPVTENYLQNYMGNLQQNLVVCGGTAYRKEKPAALGELLRWYYGTYREAIPAAQRNNAKGFIITSNNFLIEKRVFEKIRFRENIGVYGHEDTLLGYDLFKSGISILHIDNPVLHTGLEDAPVFLEKTRLALNSLYKIDTELLKEDLIFALQVNFLNRYISIKRVVPAVFLRLFFKMFHRVIEANLKGRFPVLLFLDLYKLGYYATLEKQ
ncbi:MAG TPA: hypothetical protein DER09_09780 [Prolixibacteraceae bacterium]|nr:hypothetical protein [Prolixibacteraceae bacterium]